MIGYERESHMKMAGIRTHAIVALASSLMMLISKYGFYDILFMEHIGLDPSRIDCRSGYCRRLSGGRRHLHRHMNVMGITTAAGIWATVGIGMAFGAGMYILSAASTLSSSCFNFCSIPDFSTPEVHPSSRSPSW